MRASKTRAFYIETLVLTFILLFVLSILMRVFGAAGEESLNARRKTRAAVIPERRFRVPGRRGGLHRRGEKADQQRG